MKLDTASVTVRLYSRLSPKEPYTLMTHETTELGPTRSAENGSVSFSTDVTVPEIFGAYSSIRVSVGVTVPADTAHLRTVKDLETVLEPYSDMVAEYVAGTIDKAFTSLGKPSPFTK